MFLIANVAELGYRHLPLFDYHGEQYLFSTLFVKVKVDAPVIIDWEVPVKTPKKSVSTFKSAKSVLSRGFSAERESIRRHMKFNRAVEGKKGQQPVTRKAATDGM